MAKTAPTRARNSAARLMAAQAVYQMIQRGQGAETVIPEYIEHRRGMDVDGSQLVSGDKDLFESIVNGVSKRTQELDEAIKGHLRTPSGQPRSAPEPLLKSILLCGALEIMDHQDIDVPIIISDYVDVTNAFYDKKEAGLVNGILDAIGKTSRIRK